MGNLTSCERLALRWAEVCNDPTLRNLPYKFELNGFGTIEASPRNTRAGRLRGRIVHELGEQLPSGVLLSGCSILTEMGVRVPDVAWASSDFFDRYGEATPFPQAPEICVEIRSPSDSDEEIAMKTRAFLAAGAREVWVVSEDGDLAVHDAAGVRDKSAFEVILTLPPRQSR